jgi:NAD(P)-dependent dehydrogenase (short-subunit alcohol dehydrogenase family)
MNKKVAIITGASRGIGKAVAGYLSSLGYFVVLLARNTVALKQVYDELVSKGGSGVYYTVDVSKSEQVQLCIENIIAKHGQIDLLFNNAAIWKQGTSSLSSQEIDELLQVNLNGAIYIATNVAMHMKERREGYIINISSLGGKVAQSFLVFILLQNLDCQDLAKH